MAYDKKMISSKKKRIVFCGNYRWWTPQWNYLDDDSNRDMHKNVFSGHDHMKNNIFNFKNDNPKSSEYRMKLNRVIDSSEYVLRCNHGKTSNPTTGFQFKKDFPSCTYGNSTDVLGMFVSNHESVLDGGIQTEEVIPNWFNTFSIRMGIPSKRWKNTSLSFDMSEEERKSVFDAIVECYGSKMIASKSDEISANEIWVQSNLIYRRLLGVVELFESLNRQEFIDKIKDTYNATSSSIKYLGNIFGSNIKMLDTKQYLNLCSEVRDLSISYQDLKELISHKEWAKDKFEFNHNNPEWMSSDEEVSEWMDWVKSNYHLNRGLEMIYMMLVDSRFADYDKYIIGVMGINECFDIGGNCLVNQWGEYFWMSKYIKEGKLKYLPEHIDNLYDEYEFECLTTGMNLG